MHNRGTCKLRVRPCCVLYRERLPGLAAMVSGTAKLMVALVASLIIGAAVDKYVDPNPTWAMPKPAAPAAAGTAAAGPTAPVATMPSATGPKKAHHQHSSSGRRLRSTPHPRPPEADVGGPL